MADIDRRKFLTGTAAVAAVAAMPVAPAAAGPAMTVTPLSTFIDPEVVRILAPPWRLLTPLELVDLQGFNAGLIFESLPCVGYSRARSVIAYLPPIDIAAEVD